MCVLSVVCLSGLFLRADIQAGQPVTKGPVYAKPVAGSAMNWRLSEGPWCYDHFCEGPVGEARLGLRLDLPERWQVEFGVLHRSYIQEPDRGYEVPFVTVEWRPFK